MQLKLYAAKQSIAASIDDDYSAKGENLTTLLDFHKSDEGGKNLSYYTFAFQFVVPFLAIFFLGNLLYHYIQNKTLHPVRFDADEIDEKKHEFENLKISTANMSIYVMIVCSYLFVVYVVILDCIAVNKRAFFVNEEIYHPKADNGNNTKLQLEFGIPSLLLAEDLLVLIMMVALSCMKLCTSCRKEKLGDCSSSVCYCSLERLQTVQWYNIIVGPVFCIVIHSYHILVGFIHSPHHATSILVFYALVIVTYIVTLKSAYHNLFKAYISLKKSDSCWSLLCCYFWLCCILEKIPPTSTQPGTVPPPTQPASTQPGTVPPPTQPASTQPGAAPPPTQPASTQLQPGAAPPPTQPSSTQPGAAPPPTQPSLTQPRAAPPPMQPASTQPGAAPPPTQPSSTQPRAAPPPMQPASTQPGAAPPSMQSSSTQPGAAPPPTQPSLTQPRAAPPPMQPASTQPGAAPPPTQPSSTQPRAAPPPMQPASTQPGAAPPSMQSSSTQPGAAPPPMQPASTQPGAAPPPMQPASTQPRAAPPPTQPPSAQSEENGSTISHMCILFILFLLSILIGLVFVYIAFLFILVPINNVIEDAPDRILNINQTILILLGAAITYKLYQSRKFGSLLDYMVKAADKETTNEQGRKRLNEFIRYAKENPWKRNNRKQKRKAIATVILTALNKQAETQEKKMNYPCMF